jgi:AbrB family looped-hinge helix DNA binding protein
MTEVTATVTTKGQITIPVAVRRHLGLKARDQVAFVFEEGGTVRLEVPRYSSIRSLQGAAGSLKKPMSWDEIRRIAREDFVEGRDQADT